MAKHRKTILCFLFLLDYIFADPIIGTKQGFIKGKHNFFNGGAYTSFLGVPFAAPPVGDLRWQKPQPPPPWQGVREAQEYQPHCLTSVSNSNFPMYGISNITSEDCLYLNIFIPGHLHNHSTLSLPVVLYASGGSFIASPGAMYVGTELALVGGIIVVTMNYRVGPIGYMSLGTPDLPGNYGVWDVREALIWIQENIGSFGGDTSHVTIIGQSAGAVMSSHLNILGDQDVNLFGIIAMSGTGSAISHGVARRAADGAKLLATKVGCFTEGGTSQDSMIACMRAVDGDTLVDIGNTIIPVELGVGTMNVWGPVVDGEIIPEDPLITLPAGAKNKHHYLLGYTRDDGAMFALDNGVPGSQKGHSIGVSKLETRRYIQKTFLNQFPNPDKLWDPILQHYHELESDSQLIREQAASRMITDIKYAAPGFWEASNLDRHSNGDNNLFMYEYRYHQSFSNYPDWVQGTHMDDVYSLFGELFRPHYVEQYLQGSWSDEDNIVKENSMKYFSNFAYTGHPSEGPHPVPQSWPRFRSESPQYLQLGLHPKVLDQEESAKMRLDWWHSEFLHLLQYNQAQHGQAQDQESLLSTCQCLHLVLPATILCCLLSFIIQKCL